MAVGRSPGLPTTREDWRLVGRTVRLVLSLPAYAAAALLAALASLSVFVLSRNLELFLTVILLSDLDLLTRLSILVELYPLVGIGYTLGASLVLYATAALVGVNLALVGYRLREHGLTARGSSGSVVGVVLGTLGAGCASCGAALLAGVLSMVGAGGVVALLPLDGLEFSLLAVVLLVLSTYWIARGLRGARIAGCPVDVRP